MPGEKASTKNPVRSDGNGTAKLVTKAIVAQLCLGSAYSEGEGVTKDRTEAVKWCRKAAEQGYANCAEHFLVFPMPKAKALPKTLLKQ